MSWITPTAVGRVEGPRALALEEGPDMRDSRARGDARAGAGRALGRWLFGGLIGLTLAATAHGGEPDPATYWKVGDLRSGMSGVGRTVMLGTTLE